MATVATPLVCAPGTQRTYTVSEHEQNIQDAVAALRRISRSASTDCVWPATATRVHHAVRRDTPVVRRATCARSQPHQAAQPEPVVQHDECSPEPPRLSLGRRLGRSLNKALTSPRESKTLAKTSAKTSAKTPTAQKSKSKSKIGRRGRARGRDRPGSRSEGTVDVATLGAAALSPVSPRHLVLGARLGGRGNVHIRAAKYRGAGYVARLLANATIDATGARTPDPPEAAALLTELKLRMVLGPHPNIERLVHSARLEGAGLVLLVERYDTTLGALLTDESGVPCVPAPAVVIGWALGVARGLAYVATHGIVHRDIKADNVMVDAVWAGGSPRVGHAAPTEETPSTVKLADFDVATTVGAAARPLMGTSGFIPPELLTGRVSVVTPCVDVWAYGMLLYELLTGRRPYASVRPLQVSAAVEAGRAPGPVDVPASLAALNDLRARCAAAEPAARPTPTDLVAAVGAAWAGQSKRASA